MYGSMSKLEYECTGCGEHWIEHDIGMNRALIVADWDRGKGWMLFLVPPMGFAPPEGFSAGGVTPIRLRPNQTPFHETVAEGFYFRNVREKFFISEHFSEFIRSIDAGCDLVIENAHLRRRLVASLSQVYTQSELNRLFETAQDPRLNLRVFEFPNTIQKRLGVETGISKTYDAERVAVFLLNRREVILRRFNPERWLLPEEPHSTQQRRHAEIREHLRAIYHDCKDRMNTMRFFHYDLRYEFPAGIPKSYEGTDISSTQHEIDHAVAVIERAMASLPADDPDRQTLSEFFNIRLFPTEADIQEDFANRGFETQTLTLSEALQRNPILPLNLNDHDVHFLTGAGNVDEPLDVTVHYASDAAIAKIEAAGGSVTILPVDLPDLEARTNLAQLTNFFQRAPEINLTEFDYLSYDNCAVNQAFSITVPDADNRVVDMIQDAGGTVNTLPREQQWSLKYKRNSGTLPEPKHAGQISRTPFRGENVPRLNSIMSVYVAMTEIIPRRCLWRPFRRFRCRLRRVPGTNQFVGVDFVWSRILTMSPYHGRYGGVPRANLVNFGLKTLEDGRGLIAEDNSSRYQRIPRIVRSVDDEAWNLESATNHAQRQEVRRGWRRAVKTLISLFRDNIPMKGEVINKD